MSSFATRLVFAMVMATTALALAMPARAVQLDPGGQGQVLLYPYYTVYDGQQTLLSIINTSDADQVVQVTFREALNGRSVTQFKLWLGRKDSWTGTVFALADDNIASDGAGVLTRDRSCATPFISLTGFATGSGVPYYPLKNDNYSGTNSDGGPTDLGRARHGWIEVIALADLFGPPASALTFGSNGIPASCGFLLNPVIDETNSRRPSGGLVGTASVIRVAQGTLLTSRAEALSGFTEIGLYNYLNQPAADLASVNEGVIGAPVSAKIVDDQGRRQVLTYGTPGSDSRPIDAVSATLMATRVKNEYQSDFSIGGLTDWVLTFPTEAFYTDPAKIGASTAALPPFHEPFQAPGNSRVCVPYTIFSQDRNLTGLTFGNCSFTPLPPFPGQGFRPIIVALYQSANVVTFLNVSVPPSRTAVFAAPRPPGVTFPLLRWDIPTFGPFAGWLDLNLAATNFNHRLPASAEGKVLSGLPAIGFSATSIINANVSNGVLANYASAVRHVTTVACSKASDSLPCD